MPRVFPHLTVRAWPIASLLAAWLLAAGGYSLRLSAEEPRLGDPARPTLVIKQGHDSAAESQVTGDEDSDDGDGAPPVLSLNAPTEESEEASELAEDGPAIRFPTIRPAGEPESDEEMAIAQEAADELKSAIDETIPDGEEAPADSEEAIATDEDNADPNANNVDSESIDLTPDRNSPTTTIRQLNSRQKTLRTRLRKALAINYPQHLNTRDHNPWEAMHGLIAYGTDSMFFRGGAKGPPVNAAAYLCWNGKCHGMDLLYLEKGRVMVRKGVYVQGHYGQFLAILAQAHVPSDYPIKVEGRQFTVKDLIDSEKETCETDMELTFKLISMAHYLDSDAVWECDKGEEWSIPRLIAAEIEQPILKTAACGGTHRLMGLSYAIHKRKQQGLPIDGQFARAQKYISDYHKYAFALQNPDGSFSTEWFMGKGNEDDIDRKVKTTGHILEWISFSLPEDSLYDPRTLKAVEFLTKTLLMGPKHEWEVGPHGHAIHSLRIYDRRAFRPLDDAAEQQLAQQAAQQVPQQREQQPAQQPNSRPQTSRPQNRQQQQQQQIGQADDTPKIKARQRQKPEPKAQASEQNAKARTKPRRTATPERAATPQPKVTPQRPATQDRAATPTHVDRPGTRRHLGNRARPQHLSEKPETDEAVTR